MSTVTDHAPLSLSDLRERATCTIPEAAAVLGLSSWAGYQAAQRGEIPVLTLGRRKVVPVPALLRMLDGEPADGLTPLPRPRR